MACCRLDGPAELGESPALGVIDHAALDAVVVERLWAVCVDVSGIAFSSTRTKY